MIDITEYKDLKAVPGNLISALARGFKDASVKVVTNYPGFHSNELYEELGGEITSVNENNALEIAWGAAAAGARSLVSIKNVGLNSAADPFLNAHVLSINAGFVIVVFDDIDDEHSQMYQDSRFFFNFHGGLWFEPFDKQDAYNIALNSFDISERLKTPVVIRITNILYKYDFKSKHYYAQNNAKAVPQKPYIKQPEKFAVHPVNIRWQKVFMRKRDEQIQGFVNNLHSNTKINLKNESIAIIAGSFKNNEIKPKENIFRIKTYPIPENKIKNILKKYKDIRIYEHGSSFLFDKIIKISGQFSQNFSSLSLISRKPNRRYYVRDNFEKLFSILRSYKNGIIVGDLGEFTMDLHKSIDLCLAYGASVGVASGVASSRKGKVVFAVTGDGAFLHSGRTALCEAIYRKVKMTIIIFDNGGCRGTGGQEIPGSIYDLPKDVFTQKADFLESSAVDIFSIIKKAIDFKGISVIILNTKSIIL